MKNEDTTTKGTPQGMLELNPVHDIDEKITITNDSGAAVWATPWIMLPLVRDQVLPSSKSKMLEGRESLTFKSKNGSTRSMNFRVAVSEKEQSCFR